MKKFLLFITVFLFNIYAQAQTQCLTATINGSNIEIRLAAYEANFNLQAAEVDITIGGLTGIGSAVTPLSSYSASATPQGGDVYYFSVVIPSMTGGQLITSTPILIGTLPFTGSPGAISLANKNVNKQGLMANLGENCSVVLPVELLSFKGIKKGKTSQLQWETSNEKNLVNYIIERSTDGRNFHPVGFTKPKSTSATEKVAYDFIDDQPEIGINYYRLLSKGIGKDEKYSKVISLDFGLGLSGKVYPNPLDGDLIIDLDIESNSGEVEVGIYDVVGKQVLSRKIQNNDRRINTNLPTSELAPGMYLVRVKVGSFNWERQITKL